MVKRKRSFDLLLFTVHAAIIVINDAIDHGNATETYHALKNPHAHLTDVQESNQVEYQDLLYKAKGSKCQTALLKVRPSVQLHSVNDVDDLGIV